MRYGYRQVVPGIVGQAGPAGYGDSTQIDHGRARAIQGDLEQGAGARRSVLDQRLVCGGGLKPKGECSTVRPRNALVTVGEGIIVGSVQSQGVSELSGAPVGRAIRSNQNRGVGAGSATRGVGDGGGSGFIESPPGVEIALEGHRKFRLTGVADRIGHRKVGTGARV